MLPITRFLNIMERKNGHGRGSEHHQDIAFLHLGISNLHLNISSLIYREGRQSKAEAVIGEDAAGL